MRRLISVLAASTFALAVSVGAEAPRGRMSGGVAYSLPSWFKQSFLDFREDVEEARRRDRHLLVFLHLDDCPYCARMLKESFEAGENRALLQKHFDVIAVNIRGGLDVVWTDGTRHTERSLARQLKVFGTPTLVFLGPRGAPVLRVNGYRDPEALRQALDFVRTRGYESGTFSAYVGKSRGKPVYALRSHPLFSGPESLAGYAKPVAILWEDRQCAECARFHDRTLHHPDVLAEMSRLRFVRLDTSSTQPITDLQGRSTTPAQWWRELGLSYRPAVVLYDEGREVLRVESRLYHFHFKETLRFVSGGHYGRYPTLSQYHAARREELLKRGVNIDYSE